MKQKIIALLIIIWLVLWVVFFGRELFYKGTARVYAKLARRSLEGKQSFVTGDRLYQFITFCSTALPESSKYKIIGIEESSLDKRRFVYYLYPRLESEDGQYILIYGMEDVSKGGYDLFKTLDESRYILKKRGS